jgi:uncharacterized protein YndB with AHSA1/START domain
MTEPTRTVERCLRIAATRAEVFRALLDPAALSRWMYATVHWRPEKGASYRIDWQDTAVPAHTQGEILEIDEGRRLVLSWFMERDGCETMASFDLEDDDAGTTGLRFRHSGFPSGEEWRGRFEMVSLEWDKVLENLRFHLEEGRSGAAFYLRMQTAMPASRERVYAQWIGPAGLSSWLASEAFIDPAAGGEIDLSLREGGRVRGTLRTLAPWKHLRMQWEEDGKKSLIGVSIWPAESGSVLTITQRSYAITEADREVLRATWEDRFGRLRESLKRAPESRAPAAGRAITLDRVLSAERDRVWKAWVEPAGLARWFCDRAEIDPRDGGLCTFVWAGYGEIRGQVRAIEDGSHLRFSWDIPAVGGSTEIDLRLLPSDTDPAKTRIALTHAGWGEGSGWDEEFDATQAGWRSAIAMLEFALRDGDRGPRRSFLLRRRMPIARSELWRRFSSGDGLASWTGGDATVDPREDGLLKIRLKDGASIEGRVTMAEPEQGIAFLLDAPEASYLEFIWTERSGETLLLASGFTFGSPESWPLQQRILWGERLARIGGAQT